MKQTSSITPVKINYKGKMVDAKIVSITSRFDHNADAFFQQELIKQNTLEIVKPLAKIRLVKDDLNSSLWKEGFIYELEIKPYGLFNLWGIHYIHVISIDQENTKIVTEEKNDICKVWNHSLTFTKINETETDYTDEVVLYAGKLTGFLSHFLIYSYKKRHRNWSKLLRLKNIS